MKEEVISSKQQDGKRLDWLINWLSFNDDVADMPCRDWNDNSDARIAIDEAIAKEAKCKNRKKK